MKIKHGMILAAGLGKRMYPITLKTPKPLIQIGKKNLLERAIDLLINHGIEEIAINVHIPKKTDRAMFSIKTVVMNILR